LSVPSEYSGSLSGTTTPVLQRSTINVEPVIVQRPLEAMVVKQGKQIRALYELQKSTHETVIWIRNQIKIQNEKKKKIDLSEKVFGVSKNFHRYHIS